MPWPEGDELMTFGTADQAELEQVAARLRYEERARRREPGAPLLPPTAVAREGEGDEGRAARRLKRGEADHDAGRYPIREVAGKERKNQLPVLEAAAKDAKKAAGAKGGAGANTPLRSGGDVVERVLDVRRAGPRSYQVLLRWRGAHDDEWRPMTACNDLTKREAQVLIKRKFPPRPSGCGEAWQA